MYFSSFFKAYDNIEVTVILTANSIDPTIQNEEKLLIQSYPTGVAACFFRHANPRDSFSAMDERGAKPAEIFFCLRFLRLDPDAEMDLGRKVGKLLSFNFVKFMTHSNFQPGRKIWPQRKELAQAWLEFKNQQELDGPKCSDEVYEDAAEECVDEAPDYNSDPENEKEDNGDIVQSSGAQKKWVPKQSPRSRAQLEVIWQQEFEGKKRDLRDFIVSKRRCISRDNCS